MNPFILDSELRGPAGALGESFLILLLDREDFVHLGNRDVESLEADEGDKTGDRDVNTVVAEGRDEIVAIDDHRGNGGADETDGRGQNDADEDVKEAEGVPSLFTLEGKLREEADLGHRAEADEVVEGVGLETIAVGEAGDDAVDKAAGDEALGRAVPEGDHAKRDEAQVDRSAVSADLDLDELEGDGEGRENADFRDVPDADGDEARRK